MLCCASVVCVCVCVCVSVFVRGEVYLCAHLPLDELLELVGGERLDEGLVAEKRPNDLEAVLRRHVEERTVLLARGRLRESEEMRDMQAESSRVDGEGRVFLRDKGDESNRATHSDVELAEVGDRGIVGNGVSVVHADGVDTRLLHGGEIARPHIVEPAVRGARGDALVLDAAVEVVADGV